MWGRGYRGPLGRRSDGPADGETVRFGQAHAESCPGAKSCAIVGKVPSAAKAEGGVPGRRGQVMLVECDRFGGGLCHPLTRGVPGLKVGGSLATARSGWAANGFADPILGSLPCSEPSPDKQLFGTPSVRGRADPGRCGMWPVLPAEQNSYWHSLGNSLRPGLGRIKVALDETSYTSCA